jgi:hypothetical protein
MVCRPIAPEAAANGSRYLDVLRIVIGHHDVDNPEA